MHLLKASHCIGPVTATKDPRQATLSSLLDPAVTQSYSPIVTRAPAALAMALSPSGRSSFSLVSTKSREARELRVNTLDRGCGQ